MAGAGTFLPGIQKTAPKTYPMHPLCPDMASLCESALHDWSSHTLLAGVNRMHIKQAAPSISVAAGCGICTADRFPLGILFRPADNSLSSRHLTHIYLLCFCFYCIFYYTPYMKICKHFFDIFLCLHPPWIITALPSNRSRSPGCGGQNPHHTGIPDRKRSCL